MYSGVYYISVTKSYTDKEGAIMASSNQNNKHLNGRYDHSETSNVTQKQIVAMNIYDYIQMSGLTQAEIAKRAGISKSTLSAYVSGVNYPRPAQMRALANVFGVSVGALTSTQAEKISDLNLDGYPEIVELAELCLRLTPEQRACLLDVAVAMEGRNDR